MTDTGSDLLVKQLLEHEVTDFFHVIGGPMTRSIIGALDSGIRGIGVRDERAAAYAAIAYSRIARRPGIVMACSGPGTINTVNGVAHAFADGSPVIVLGGSASIFPRRAGSFQASDQVGIMRPITKWAHQVTDASSIPASIARAFEIATSGAPGPVYLDLPEDVLYASSEFADGESCVVMPRPYARCGADPVLISRAADLLQQADRPIVIAGSGVLWSQAWRELQAFVEAMGIPFYTTPMASGLIPEDHALSFQAARSTALREADCLLVIGTRDNYVFNYFEAPVISANSKLIELNSNPDDLSQERIADVAVLSDAKLGIAQLAEEMSLRAMPLKIADWIDRLSQKDAESRARSESDLFSEDSPMHPLRLAAEVRKASPREAIMVVDGRDTLGFARRAIAAYLPSGMLNPGTFGTMGIGVPYALGAKVASPNSSVVALIGDGAFGYHMTEIDTAVRHRLGFVCVVANNAGWTGHRERPGHALEYSDYHRLSEVFGCWGAKASDASELRAAMKEALSYVDRENKPAVINAMMASARSSSRPCDFRVGTQVRDEYVDT